MCLPMENWHQKRKDNLKKRKDNRIAKAAAAYEAAQPAPPQAGGYAPQPVYAQQPHGCADMSLRAAFEACHLTLIVPDGCDESDVKDIILDAGQPFDADTHPDFGVPNKMKLRSVRAKLNAGGVKGDRPRRRLRLAWPPAPGRPRRRARRGAPPQPNYSTTPADFIASPQPLPYAATPIPAPVGFSPQPVTVICR